MRYLHPLRPLALLILFALLALLPLVAPGRLHAQTAPTMGAVGDYLYPHLHNLVWHPDDPQRVYATSPIGGWTSADAGRTWAPLSPDTPNIHYGRLLLEPSTRALYLYRWGDPILRRSTDFGVSWQTRSPAMIYGLALVPGASASLYALHGDWRLRRSDDGGATWRDLAQPASRAEEMVFAVAPRGELFALTSGQLFRSSDEGRSWSAVGNWPAGARPRELLVAADGALVASIASDDKPSVSARAVWRSTDNGATWVEARLPAARIAVLAQASDGAFWLGSDDGRVWWTAPRSDWANAASWHELPMQLAQPSALRSDIPYTPMITDISPGPNGVVLIGTIHGIYRAASSAGPALLRARGLLPTAALPSAPVARPADGLYFELSGHGLREPFLSGWQHAGGLATLGLPRSEPFLERNLDTGRDELVQYFERGRLGHPVGQLVQLGLGRVGPPLLAEAGIAPVRETPRAGCRYFAATGQNLCGAMLAAWQTHGELNYLGYPLGPASGSGQTSQWFERGRLEQPTSGAPFLCLVGSEELQARGWLP